MHRRCADCHILSDYCPLVIVCRLVHSYQPRRYVLMIIIFFERTVLMIMDLPNCVPFHASLSEILIASLFYLQNTHCIFCGS